ncbi:MAG: hypothetical protein R2734_18910 [Nocardioides sp.]
MEQPPHRGAPAAREAVRPLLGAVARIPGEGARLSPEAAGRGSPRWRATRTPKPLCVTSRPSPAGSRARRPSSAPCCRCSWSGSPTPDPDAGLLGFRRISGSLGRTHWYLKTLRDEGEVASRLARVLATSAMRPTCSSASRGASDCWATTSRRSPPRL